MSSAETKSVQHAGSTQQLARILSDNHRGKPVGIYSICSANPFVLEAGMLQARRDGNLLLVESSSNQVNQFGGYTGQNPQQFASFVKNVAADMNFPAETILLGGDHLGPHPWRQERAASAMQKAIDLVKACVLAGYTKIHLDASMRLGDDSGDASNPLADEVISARAADLCHAAEEAHRLLPSGSHPPLYVIGAEVPIPGGELHEGLAPPATRSEDLEQTIATAKRALEARGLKQAWERVLAVVVQSGAEFGDAAVFPYNPAKARGLSHFAEKHWHGVFEAHSTDYQTPAALRQMVRDHFAILKVGPWLTFTFRETVFALAAIEEEWLARRRGVTLSRIRETLDEAMLANPEYWKGYYHGDDEALRFARKFSLSDRIRYYWPQPNVNAALNRLLANLSESEPPLSLLSQYLPDQYAAVRDGKIPNRPRDLIRNKVLEVMDCYANACGMTEGRG